MPAKKNPKTAPLRRSQVSRSDATRVKAIDAATELLFTAGHAATTMLAVANRAKLSRGALQHQFDTRTQLLIQTAQHLLAAQSRYRREHIVDTAPGKKRYYSALEINWEVQKQHTSIALLEIMMASRNDPELRKNLDWVFERGDQVRREAAKLAAGDLGIDDIEVVDDMLNLHVAALRGLALQLILGRDVATVERIRKLFTLYERRFAESLVEKRRAR